ncbi:MAG: hypothetical protein V2I48_13245, partial [Xanthomonadales bacterium]|nr:hypothetical protein [Xanthomonadales bacterium]
KHWLWMALKIVLVVEIVYVVVINGLLQLPYTQTVLNKIRPEKFHISWENAWSWYPARVHIRNASANGNSSSQMWQVDVDAATGYISLVPLIFKRVQISGVEGRNIEYRMRPWLKPDKDYSGIEAFFPVIEGREVTPAVPRPSKKNRPWNISVDGIQVGGDLRYWIYQFRGQTGGHIKADLDYRSRGGPLALDVYDLDLDMGAHYINGDREVFQQGKVKGSMGFAPFIPRENKGLPMLDFLLLDLDMDIDVNSLRFIKLFMLSIPGADVDGRGRVNGRLHFEKGFVMDGTDLSIDARDLHLEVMAHGIRGRGDVDLLLGPETDGEMSLVFRFRDLNVVRDGDSNPLLTGDDLVISVGGDGRLVPIPGKVNASRALGLEIDGLTVPDLALFQRYLPEKWPFRLHGGDGTLQGDARLTPTAFTVDLALDSDAADMGIAHYRFETNLDAVLKLDNPDIRAGGTRVDGSYIALNDAYLVREEQKGEKVWSAALTLNNGEFHLVRREDRRKNSDVIDLFRILGSSEAKSLLGDSGGRIEFNASVSSLAWIDVFLRRKFNSDIGGSSNIAGVLYLANGLPEPGTDVRIESSALAVNILDYISHGEGVLTLSVLEGGMAPDWQFDLELNDADLRRRSDDKAYIQDVMLRIAALVEDVTFRTEEEKDFTMTMAIDSARVTDMSVFNHYLPPDSPLVIAGGEAQLAADILLQEDDADGWVRLDSKGITALVDDQSLLADLGVDIELVGGRPADMVFDIAGSRILLDNVFVQGAEDRFEDEKWSAELELTRGVTEFNKPVRLDLEADLKISDSRPIVAMYRNQEGWRPEFLARMMTLEDIGGTGELKMADERIVIPHAHVLSDNAEAGFKGVISGQGRDGVIYFRYKKFNALLKIRDGRKTLDLIRVRQKFDEYQVDP